MVCYKPLEIEEKKLPIEKTGIHDLAWYVPHLDMNLDLLVKARITEDPSLDTRLHRAVSTTGQRHIRFPEAWEDPVTIAAEATRNLLDGYNKLDYKKMRYLSVGTETTVDHSKSASAYILGLLQKGGYPLIERLSSFQVQHACAGGTLAMLGINALLATSGITGETGIVASTDIARYARGTTAEITQGAGAVSVLLGKNPELLELDLQTLGYSSKDVDDFFRPLGSKIAMVKGRYSITCYNDALESSFLDHCELRGLAPEEVLRKTDYFVLHTPFRNMPISSLNLLVSKYLEIDSDEADRFLEARGFQDSVDPLADIGNTYTASVFFSLAFLLHQQYRKLGQEIVGKEVLLGSYGSGNTMILMRFTITEGAPEVLSRWNMEDLQPDTTQDSFREYEQWMEEPDNRDERNRALRGISPPKNRFFLSGVREDGYREYSISP
jgi:hydroxymethylglutaryl-CoA synthase